MKIVKTHIYIVLLLLWPMLIVCQKEDHIWLFGTSFVDNYDPEAKKDTLWGNSTIDFNYDPPKIYYDSCLWLDFWGANSSIADKEGNLLFYSNGQALVDSSHHYIEDTINYSTDWRANSFVQNGVVVPIGLAYQQSILIIPVPNHQNTFYAIYSAFDVFDKYIYILRNSKLRINEFQEWEVLEKDKILLEDSLSATGITTCQHSNGRDLWMVLPNYNSTLLYTYLITPNDIVKYPSQELSIEYEGATGMKSFSPDGRYFAMNDAYLFDADNVLSIYDFDRTTGKISNPRIDRFPTIVFGNGVAFSRDSKKLYATNDSFLYQYDLEAEDVIESRKTVGTYDGFLSYSPGFPGRPTKFGYPALGPDGKIYISAGSGSNRYLHVIHDPNALGEECNLTQHSIKLPTSYARTIPNFPHYRLGPLDGSSADTLGIDNHPVSKFRTVQDSSDYLTFDFVDLSYYAPDQWSWDFGDSHTSDVQNPRHTFASSGVYEVCLIASNMNSEDTFCKTLQIGSVGIKEHTEEVELSVFPNPGSEYIYVRLHNYYPQNATAVIVSMEGKTMKEFYLKGAGTEQDISKLPVGNYLLVVLDQGKVVTTEKLVKI